MDALFLKSPMYRLKIAGMDQVSFGPVPVLMVVKIIWSTVNLTLKCLVRTFALYIFFFGNNVTNDHKVIL